MVGRWNVGKTAVLAVLVICILPGTTTYDRAVYLAIKFGVLVLFWRV